jgi:hypothetical protein
VPEADIAAIDEVVRVIRAEQPGIAGWLLVLADVALLQLFGDLAPLPL